MSRGILYAAAIAAAALGLMSIVPIASARGPQQGSRACAGKVHLSGTTEVAIEITVRDLGCPRAKVLLRQGIESAHDFECRVFDRPRGLRAHCRKERPNGTVVAVGFLAPDGGLFKS